MSIANAVLPSSGLRDESAGHARSRLDRSPWPRESLLHGLPRMNRRLTRRSSLVRLGPSPSSGCERVDDGPRSLLRGTLMTSPVRRTVSPPSVAFAKSDADVSSSRLKRAGDAVPSSSRSSATQSRGRGAGDASPTWITMRLGQVGLESNAESILEDRGDLFGTRFTVSPLCANRLPHTRTRARNP